MEASNVPRVSVTPPTKKPFTSGAPTHYALDPPDEKTVDPRTVAGECYRVFQNPAVAEAIASRDATITQLKAVVQGLHDSISRAKTFHEGSEQERVIQGHRTALGVKQDEIDELTESNRELKKTIHTLSTETAQIDLKTLKTQYEFALSTQKTSNDELQETNNALRANCDEITEANEALARRDAADLIESFEAIAETAQEKLQEWLRAKPGIYEQIEKVFDDLSEELQDLPCGRTDDIAPHAAPSLLAMEIGRCRDEIVQKDIANKTLQEALSRKSTYITDVNENNGQFLTDITEAIALQLKAIDQ